MKARKILPILLLLSSCCFTVDAKERKTDKVYNIDINIETSTDFVNTGLYKDIIYDYNKIPFGEIFNKQLDKKGKVVCYYIIDKSKVELKFETVCKENNIKTGYYKIKTVPKAPLIVFEVKCKPTLKSESIRLHTRHKTAATG